MAQITIFHAFKAEKPNWSEVHRSEFDVERKRIKNQSNVLSPAVYDKIEELAHGTLNEFVTGNIHLWKFEVQEDL